MKIPNLFKMCEKKMRDCTIILKILENTANIEDIENIVKMVNNDNSDLC